MPGVNPDTKRWLEGQLAQMKRDIQALKSQTTNYMVNPATGQCVMIQGDISHDTQGNATGLTGYGLAQRDLNGNWMSLGLAGSVYIPGQQQTSSASYTTLATPDQISNVIVPNRGVVWVQYYARWWQLNGTGTANALLYFNNTPIYSMQGSVWDNTTPTTHGTPKTSYQSLVSGSNGLGAWNSGGSVICPTATQMAGPIAYNFAAAPIVCPAGTYNVSVQFQMSGGSGDAVLVDNRTLLVWTQTF